MAKLINVLRVNPKSLFYGGVSLINGIAQFVGEAQTDPATKDKVLKGEVQLVFITPEGIICNSVYQKMLLSVAYTDKLVAVVVDEAHCVRTWGDEFRTAFAQIGDLRSLIPTAVNIMTLTVTSETFDVVTLDCQWIKLFS